MLGRDFVSWAGHRLWSAGALVGAGAAVEGISILFLIPLLGIILNGQGSSETTVHVLSFLPQATTPTLGPALVGFAVLLCLRFWILYVRDTTLARLEQDYVVALRLRLFNRLASASWATAADLGRGQIGHALSRDIDRASVSVGAVLRGGAASVMLAVQVSLALWLAPLVALAAFALGAGVFALLAPLRRRAHRLGHDITQDDFRLFSTVQVFLRGLKPAKAHGLETQYLRVLEDAASAFGQRMLQMRRDILLGSLSMQAAMGILALGAVYIAHGWLDASPEVLIVLLLLMARLGAPLQQLQLAAQALRLGDAAYQAAIGSVAGGETSKRPTRSDSLHAAPVIELRSVTVIGDANSVVLSNITATIPAGEATAITGASGSGKTTLCDVLAGLVQPTKGHVFVDGTELHPALLDSLSVSLAYVGQDDPILEDTLRAHLTFGANSPSDDAIWAALDVTGAAEAVRNVAEGLDAKLRFDAARFSGGERQRLRLSRALLRRPKLLILDEATSALDLSSERAVLNNVFAALGEATVVMVTHRPETAALATHQLYLNAGVLETV